MKTNYLIVFFISLLSITLELLFTRILNLKTWNHIVYIIIPFAILGYGIGANFYLIGREFFNKIGRTKFFCYTLFALSICSIYCTLTLIDLHIFVDNLRVIHKNYEAILMLLVAYAIVMLPFVVIGLMITYIFSTESGRSHKLYFIDLLGAGMGAYLFFPLINTTEIFHSVLLLSFTCIFIAIIFLFKKFKAITLLLSVMVAANVYLTIPEPTRYFVDPSKGWEWIPGTLPKNMYKTKGIYWHPLGRTDIYQITDPQARRLLYEYNIVPFQLNVTPTPEFAYFTTNFLAGTPAYHYASLNQQDSPFQIKPFSVALEVPYTLKENPSVLIIGTGGGRDIFMAKTHQARSIIGAEINQATYKAMSSGGILHEYTDRVYTAGNVKVHNVDGRHLVKTIKENELDLIVLNGVDTFTGLSSGAYAYAENYLYTKNAIIDYLYILNSRGIINFNRHYHASGPRETLKLLAISLEALKSAGATKPWEHIILGTHSEWSLLLIKKTPFTPDEINKVTSYLYSHDSQLAYPETSDNLPYSKGSEHIRSYVQMYKQGKASTFAKDYPFDISVIDDNKPFFYKHYKFKQFNPFGASRIHHTGTIVFLTQSLVLTEALIFILLFMFTPLYIFKKGNIKKLPRKSLIPFIVYFSCLGMGFMFLEIPLMQKFTLLLGQPIYSISVTLAVLLISTGIGSVLLTVIKKAPAKLHALIPAITSILILLYLVFMECVGVQLIDFFMAYSFAARVLLVIMLLAPLGILLGIFFPSGLLLISDEYEAAIAWAWALNGGFSVLGSITAIILAQFKGFNFVMALACIVYVMAGWAYWKMHRHIAKPPAT